ncbi:rod shape-determining protein RodA [Photobacterium gaetbulicola]|uniref:Peptidoglycan glycosyltransferase MrdB n=1 Tax=Photobacterium gaetbulicola Gung47 TaxID=658445 RepID=A0A0C5WIH0_9GAMM|nr:MULTISPECIES: rod shape-determining protein RodA [Photobacterium]AJR05962.1 rod shape-determining protein roda [Photobacterium gaetbulicola Gung47]PSU13229.1 rod shape-determining protein RodA [Photobacterium gaetbulicola]WEM45643.1 rod shape-determining protein RodA [Photobacterium sp. DA100]
MLNYRPRIDYPLLLAISLLILLGSLTVWSASGFSEPMLERHLIRALIALICLVVMSAIPPIKYQHAAPYLYGLSVVLLLGVIVMGDSTNGSQRWLALGPIRFQPSELVKVAIPMMVAWLLVVDAGRPDLKKIGLCLLVTGLPAGLIFIQPDLDGAIFTIIYALFVLYFAGMSWKIIGSFLGGIATAVPLLWYFVMEAYQKKRVTQFLDPESDPLGAGYQIIQSLIAIGSGGIKGKGWTNATQGHLGFIPESHTDFIFSTYAEEWGFIGSLLLLGLYLFITGRVIWLACQCESPFNRLVSGSLSLSFFLYAFINMGMVSGVLPVMGSPLPFFSYGGTAMITQGVCFGIIMSLCLYKPYKSK